MSNQAEVYILTSRSKKVFYVGVTSCFTQKYQVHDLVHYELFDTMIVAIEREKQLKKWHRAWKEKLITDNNPQWLDLYDSLL